MAAAASPFITSDARRPGFSASVGVDHERAEVALRGELDYWSAPLLVRQLDELALEVRSVTFDAAELAFIDCAGLRPVLATARRLGGTGSVVVAHPSAMTRRVVAILGLDHLLAVEG